MYSPSVALLAEVFDNLPNGVVVLDPRGRVVIFNRAEERLAGRQREQVLGREFFKEVAPCMNVRQLGLEFSEKIGREGLDLNVELSFPFPFLEEPRDVLVRLKSFDIAGVPHAILAIEDVSLTRSLDRMKTTLQNLVVHDLKNPLAEVVANLGFLKGIPSLRDNKDALEAITESVEAAGRLQGMLLNLLDVTRLETNSFPLVRAPTDLCALVHRVVRGNRASAMLRAASVNADVPEASIDAWIDEGAIRRALDNLVENASRHSKHVVVAARVEGPMAVLEVGDDGPGIPDALREAIFEKYTQVMATKGSRATDNRGLGLTFVRLAARAHGGEASVECPPSGGSRFRLRLPMSASSVHPPA